MSFRLGELRAYLGYEVVAAVCAALLLDREDRFVCCFAAAAAHELGHIIMMRLYSVRVRGISVRLFDVLIEADSPPSFRADCWITLGGALMNLILAAVCISFGGFFGTANLAMGCFNLMPVISLDGGRLLTLILTRRLSQRAADIILRISSFLILLPLLTAGVYVLFRSGYNYSLLLLSLYLLAVLFLKQ